jgi:hypothetical protein
VNKNVNEYAKQGLMSAKIIKHVLLSLTLAPDHSIVNATVYRCSIYTPWLMLYIVYTMVTFDRYKYARQRLHDIILLLDNT